MMTTQSGARIGIARGLVGILLCTAAMYLGWVLGGVTAGLLGGEPGIWARTGKGLVWGAVMAGLQWPIVRGAGVLPARFCLASAVGLAVGYPLGQTIQGVFDDRSSVWVWGYGGALATFGLSMGLPQWWVLRRHVRRAGLLILFSALAWTLTGVAWVEFGVNSGVDSGVYGFVTGLGLAWLAHPQPPDESGRGHRGRRVR